MRRFTLRLARDLGYASPRRMLAEITSQELTEWMELYNAEPWGQERTEVAIAIAASGICNAHGARTQPKDFVPDFSERKPMSLAQWGILKGAPRDRPR